MGKTDGFITKIEEIRQNHSEISIRRFLINNIEINILFIQQITDRHRLSTDIIKPLLENKHYDYLSADSITDTILYIDDTIIDNDENKIIDYILKGRSVIILSNDNSYVVCDTSKVEKRKVSSPEVESTLRGSKDAFIENLDTNISLIRYRIKDENLKIDRLTIGKRSKTTVAVIYINNIANHKVVNDVKKRLNSINIDGVFESGYIQKFILNNAFDIFPQVGLMERSDTACENILDGKVCILVEGNNLALVLPKTFIEFLDASDDHYETIYISIFSKILRLLSLLASLTFTSLYVAIVAFQPDILPPKYILAIAASRATVPFNGLLEGLIMEFIAEVLREASIRLPQQIGPAISIVGAIVIGQAAVAAGLVSPLVVIIVSLSIMTSFAAGDYSIINPIRILKYMLILVTGVFGIFGFTIGLIIITINLCSIESFGVSYMAPLAPFNFTDLKNFILSDITLAKKRPKFLQARDKTRQ